VKFRPTILEVLVVVAIVGILSAVFFPGHHHRPHPVKEQELFGYWIAIPEAHSVFRLFLTNGGSGWLGSRDIYTNLYRVAAWHVTNRDIVIDLTNMNEPTWPPEYIRGQVGLGRGHITGVRGGVNQNGEHWTRDITFYPEQTVLQDLAAAVSVMTNHFQTVERNGAGNETQPPGTPKLKPR
jgi:hypothetical protein